MSKEVIGSADSAPGLRVLLVEDNELVADSLAALLRRDGHRVDVAHTGAAALEIAPLCRPHLALVDIGLPDMDGYEVACRLRRQEELRDIVLVAITGRSDDETNRLALEAGFACRLIKPVSFAGLHGILARAARATPPPSGGP